MASSILTDLFRPTISSDPALAASRAKLDTIRRNRNNNFDQFKGVDLEYRSPDPDALGEVRSKLTALDRLSSNELHDLVNETKKKLAESLSRAG